MKILKLKEKISGTVSRKRGTSLMGILVATMLVAITFIVGFNFHVFITKTMLQHHTKLTAVILASSQTEDLLEKGRINWADTDLTAGNHAATITVPAGFGVTYVVADKDWNEDGTGDVDYKRFTVSCTYTGGTITLYGYIAQRT